MAITLNGTTGIVTADGSVGAPSLKGTDADSGVSFAADSIKFSTGGTERFSISNSGLSGDGSGLSGITSGLAEADQWRVHTTFSSNADPITTNWERNDNSFDKVGTGMSESSGIFTFPSTGIWKIDYQAGFSSTGNTHYGGAYVKATTDNSSYSRIGYTYTSIDDGSGTWYGGASGTVMFDVTNVSTHKVCLEIGMDAANCLGSSTEHVTGLTFMKLGDT